jgi:prepilin-type N-terminal cleavage/methylation domain-containing protein
MEQRERIRAFTLLSVRARHTPATPKRCGGGSLPKGRVAQLNAVTRLPRRSRAKEGHHSAFTLLELLVVIAIIAVLLVALIPVVSISKSSTRKGAISNLLGAIEQGRAEAIKTGHATYVVFPTFAAGTSQTTLDRYNYKSFAIYEDDPANVGTPKQLTKWQTFPTGVAIRAAGSSPLSNLTDAAALTPALTLKFIPDSNATPAFRCIKFNANGEIESPNANVVLTVFEGYVNGTAEVVTSSKDASGEPAARESIIIARLTGRAERQ